MLTKLTLALTTSLLLSAQATSHEKKQPPTAPPQILNDVLWATPSEGAMLERGA